MAGKTTMIAAVAIAAAALATPAGAQTPLKMTLFGQPSVNNDSIWLALERGLYKAEGLDVTYRLFPSGTTAFQSFQTGQGDIVMTGDLPSVQYFFRSNGNYRTIAAIERDAKGYVVIAAKEIAKPQDLVGKTIATRVGSTGSWFISEYLKKNGVDASKVTVKNLDTQVLPAALCGGEIAAFFIWQPIGSRTLEICPDKAHQLSDATGYVQGYLVAGARPEYFPVILALAATGVTARSSSSSAMAAMAVVNGPVRHDFCSLSHWAREEKLTDQPVDFTKLTWPDGLRAISAKLVDAPPPPC